MRKMIIAALLFASAVANANPWICIATGIAGSEVTLVIGEPAETVEQATVNVMAACANQGLQDCTINQCQQGTIEQ